VRHAEGGMVLTSEGRQLVDDSTGKIASAIARRQLKGSPYQNLCLRYRQHWHDEYIVGIPGMELQIDDFADTTLVANAFQAARRSYPRILGQVRDFTPDRGGVITETVDYGRIGGFGEIIN